MLVALAVILTLPATAKSDNNTLIPDNHTQEVVVLFVKKPIKTFPDRASHANEAKAKDEAKRLEAIRQAELAKVVNIPVPAKTTPQPAVSGLDDAFMQLSYCEAGGKATTNTGNGYYGAFQYDLGTWANYGGYARPDLAPFEVQLAKAKETQARRGWSPWPACARKLGL